MRPTKPKTVVKTDWHRAFETVIEDFKGQAVIYHEHAPMLLGMVKIMEMRVKTMNERISNPRKDGAISHGGLR